MKKLVRNVAYIMAASVILASCQKNENENGTTEPEETGNAVATIVLSSVTGYATEPGSDAENQIKSLEFYTFDKDGNPDAVKPYYELNQVTGKTISYAVASGVDKKFVVVANMNLGNSGVSNYTSLKKKLATAVLTDANSRTIAAGEFQMSGETTATVISERTDNRVPIVISRLVSKIYAPSVSAMTIEMPKEDIEELYGEGTTITNADISFEFGGFGIVNGLNCSDVVFSGNDANDETQEWDKWSHDGKLYFDSKFKTDKDFEKIYSGFKNGSWLLDNNDIVYVYENKPVRSTYEGIDGFTKKSVYAAIIKGTLKVSGESDIVRFWRVNYIKEDNYTMFRNCVYKASVSSLISNGYETPEEAEEDGKGGPNIPDKNQTGVIVELDIADWGLKLFTTEM